jgi:hypothetical protein
VIATKKNLSIQQPLWNDMLGDRLINLQPSKQQTKEFIQALMPKDTNNFYQFRVSGQVIGYIRIPNLWKMVVVDDHLMNKIIISS